MAHPLRLSLVALASALLAAPLAAGTHTWTGNSATTGHWSDAANWDSLPALDGNDDLVFPGPAGRKIISNDFAAGTTFKSITFSGSDGGYSISGNAITLTVGITDQTTFLAEGISCPIALGADVVISVTQRSVGLSGIVSGAHKI